MKFFYLLFFLNITIYYSSIILADDMVTSNNSIRADESIESYQQRINKKPIKTITTIKVISPYKEETYNGQYIITQEMIQNSGAVSVVDLLKKQPAIYIQSNGDFGQSATVSLNGSHPQHVAILLDGVRLDDPSNAQPFFDIGQIPLYFVEEIEIIKGPSSVLYGSGAVAGVINIKTKKYQENIASIKQEVGTSNTLTVQTGVNANIENLNITLFANFFKTDGFSIASNSNNGKKLENDKSELKDINLKLNYKFSEDSYIDSFFKIANSNTEYDGFDIVPLDVEGNYLDKKENLYYFTYNFKVFSSFYNKLKFSQYRSNKRYVENFNSKKNEYFFFSKEQVFGYKGSYTNELLSFDGGFDFESKKMDYAEQLTNDFSFYSNLKEYLLSGFSLEQGFRLDQNQKNLSMHDTVFTNNTAYNIGLSLDVSADTYIKLNYGYSYRLPSLYELFSVYGNPKLIPESAEGINFEFSSGNFSSFFQQFQFNAFYSDVSNMIYFNNFSYKNIGDYTNLGFDISFPFYITNFLYLNDLKILPTYTYIVTQNNTYKDNFNLIPKHKFNTTFDLDITHKYHLLLNSLWVSSTTNFLDNTTYILPSYWVNNFMISRSLANSSKLYFRIDNVFNERYQTNYGYNTKGRSYYFGLIIEM